eukprot:1425559-Rhodomonas_salina.1
MAERDERKTGKEEPKVAKPPKVAECDERKVREREEEPKAAVKPIQKRTSSRLHVDPGSATDQEEGKPRSKVAAAALNDSTL